MLNAIPTNENCKYYFLHFFFYEFNEFSIFNMYQNLVPIIHYNM